MTIAPIRAHIVDCSALVRLINADADMMRFYAMADAEERLLICPALAITAATVHVDATEASWEAILWPVNVVVTPLSAVPAIGIGATAIKRSDGGAYDSPLSELQAVHTAWEARRIGSECWIVTAEPRRYAGSGSRMLTLTAE